MTSHPQRCAHLHTPPGHTHFTDILHYTQRRVDISISTPSSHCIAKPQLWLFHQRVAIHIITYAKKTRGQTISREQNESLTGYLFGRGTWTRRGITWMHTKSCRIVSLCTGSIIGPTKQCCFVTNSGSLKSQAAVSSRSSRTILSSCTHLTDNDTRCMVAAYAGCVHLPSVHLPLRSDITLLSCQLDNNEH